MIDTTGREFFSLFALCISRACSAFFSLLFKNAILSLIRLLSISSFVSPGPLPPIPPVSLDKESSFAPSRGRIYLSWASSTRILPSLLFARLAKISSISWVLSNILSSVNSETALDWDGDKLLSKTIYSAPLSSALITASLSLPGPTTYFGCISFFTCGIRAIIFIPALRASSSSSSKFISHSSLLLNTPVNTAYSPSLDICIWSVFRCISSSNAAINCG